MLTVLTNKKKKWVASWTWTLWRLKFNLVSSVKYSLIITAVYDVCMYIFAVYNGIYSCMGGMVYM